MKWTDGRALVATGIPVNDIEYNGTTYNIGQANNALIYPGVGFGAIATESKKINNAMLAAAAHSLVGLVDPDKPGAAVLPPVRDMAKFSKTVAIAVAQSAIDQGFSSAKNAQEAVEKMTWEAKY